MNPTTHYSTQLIFSLFFSGILQHTAAHYSSSILQHTTHLLPFFQQHTTAHGSTLQHTTHLLSFSSSTLQHMAAHYSTWQHIFSTQPIFSLFSSSILQHMAAHYSTQLIFSLFSRQHTTAHGSTLQLGKFEFFNLKIILEKNLTKIQEYFLSYNNL